MNQRREVRFEIPKGDKLHQGKCTACGASIFWILTKNDKRMPLSAASARLEEDGSKTYVSHFSDCPQADHFRRRP